MALGARRERRNPLTVIERRRRSIILRAVAVSGAAILLVAIMASTSAIVGGRTLARIVLEARCIEVSSTQLLRSAEMSRRVREIQLAPNRTAQLVEAYGLRGALVASTEAKRRLQSKGDRSAPDRVLDGVDKRFTADIGAVLSAVDVEAPVSSALRRRIDRDAQDYAVVEGALLESLRASQRKDQTLLEIQQRVYAGAIASIIVLLALLLVAPTLRRAATVLEELAREDEAEKRRATERALAAVFEQSRTSVALLDERGVILQGNSALAQILGVAEVRDGAENLPSYLASTDALVPFFDGDSHRFPIHLTAASGEERWGDASISPVAGSNAGANRFLLVLEDVTARRALEERLRHEAAFDSLTNIENRRAMRERIAGALADGASGFVTLIDLDNFKVINDNDGHSVGDEVLAEVAKRLKATFAGTAAAGRMGGDEFVGLVTDVDAAAFSALLERVIDAIARPIRTSTRVVTVTASIGAIPLRVGVGGHIDESSVDRILRAADVALYQAKALGRNRFVIDAHAELDGPVPHHPGPAEIREGLAGDEFVLHYQPIIDFGSRRCIALEALVRWDRGGAELVPPSAFIAMAERSGTIIALGSWILTRACADFAAMLADGLPDTTDLHVNVSALQIAQPDFPQLVARALEQSELSARRLVLEVTEGTLVSYQAEGSRTLDQVRWLGVRWCIDDFGMGYSSLAYLNTLPVACMKIDRSFVSDGDSDRLSNPAIVNMILQLARILGIAVIAEGVETADQASALAGMECYALQGYAFARPMSRSALSAYSAASESGYAVSAG
jgi:diguanylate cyclase (GGDEF)-like protein